MKAAHLNQRLRVTVQWLAIFLGPEGSCFIKCDSANVATFSNQCLPANCVKTVKIDVRSVARLLNVVPASA